MSLLTRLTRYLERQSEGAGPVRGTSGTRRMFMIWLAANLVVTTLLTGTLFVPHVPYATVLVLIVVGTLIGASVLVSVGTIGQRTGLPTMALTRGSFGTRGSFVPLAANVSILMGWSWVQAMLAGISLNVILASVTGFSSPMLCAVICQTIVVILALFGHAGVARVEPWLAAVILLIAAYVFAVSFVTHSPSDFASMAPGAEPVTTPGLVFDAVVATAISWTVLSADINRFARSTRASVVGGGAGYSTSTIVSMSLGATAIGYVALSGGDPVSFSPTVIIAPFGWVFALAIFLSVMATNTMVVYGMVTSVVNAVPGRSLRFLPVALILGSISIVGSTFFGLLARFTEFLVVIGALFAPIFAVMIVDYYLIKRGSYTRDILSGAPGRYWYRGGMNPAAIVAWAAGAGLAWVWAYLWPLPFGSTIPAFAATFVLYLALMWHRRPNAAVAPVGNLADS